MHKPDMAQLWHKELMPAVLMLYITTVPYLVQGAHNCWESKWENCLQALALPCLTLQHVCCCITKGTQVGLLDGSMKALPSIPIHNMYHSLTKECPQVHQRGGWVLFQVLPHLIMKDHPCHVYSESMPWKQIVGKTITYNGAINSFEVKSRAHH